jgi:hypothetical protein
MKCLHVTDLDDPTTIREVDADLKSNGTAVLNGDKENIVFTAYLFPMEAKQALTTICMTRQRLKAEYDKSMGLVYQLRNQHSGWEKK